MSEQGTTVYGEQVGDSAICSEHGYVQDLLIMDDGTAMLICPICLEAAQGEVGQMPREYANDNLYCPVHRTRCNDPVLIEEYDPALDAVTPSVAFSCPVCVEEYAKAHPQIFGQDDDIGF